MTNLRYVQVVKNQRGEYHYLRYGNAQRVTITGAPGSAEYLANYERLLGEAKGAVARADAKHAEKRALKTKGEDEEGTIDAVVRQFLNSGAFKAMKPATKLHYERNLRSLCNYDMGDGRFGTELVTEMTRKVVRGMLGKVVPAPSNKNFLGCLRALMRFCAIDLELISEDSDPTIGVTVPKIDRADDDEGFKCWLPEHVEWFRDRWPLGSMPRNAMELMIYSGAACADVIRLGRANIKPDRFGRKFLVYKRQKTGTTATNPLWPELEAYLDRAYPPDWEGPFLLDGAENPWNPEMGNVIPLRGHRTKSGNIAFSRWFRDQCIKAGVPTGYSAHGLRKRYATDLVEQGRSLPTVMRAGGWKKPATAARYFEKADAMALWDETKTRETA
jgi:integrase